MRQMLVHDQDPRLHRCHYIRLLQLNKQTLLFLFRHSFNCLIISNLTICNRIAAIVVRYPPILLLMSYRTDFERVIRRVEIHFRCDDRTVHATHLAEIDTHIRVDIEVKSWS